MFHAATSIGTEDGPVAVEMLQPGMRLLTETGAETAALVSIQTVVLPRSDWVYAPALWPIRVPVGTLGNDVPIRMSPGIRVALPGLAGMARLADLVGIGGVTRDRPLADIRYFELHLADHMLIRAEGALCESAPMGPREVRPTLPRDEARIAFGRLTGRPGA